jgi:hypothetical protein
VQDALGRSALMFAAGNGARNTLIALLDAGELPPQESKTGARCAQAADSGLS